MKYQARREAKLSTRELAVYDEFGFSEKFARLLEIRGINTREKVTEFMDFSLERLHDPFLLKGMGDAVDRINRAAAKRERILIIGDYDADGICSVAILYKYLLSRHVTTRYFLPDRDADGYGLNVELVKNLCERFKPNLIITVDSGISCPKEIEFAKSLGVDCIVTDHHTIPSEIPDCTCINPKFADQDYPFSDLCGAGVALKLVQALGEFGRDYSAAALGERDDETRRKGMETAGKYLDICAIATVADIVSLRGENRVIVARGLEMLNRGSLPSVTALARASNVWGSRLTAADISFKLGPKINASGRMGNAKRGLDIILEQNPAEIEKIIGSLTHYNTQRQKLCNKIFDEADAMIESGQLYKNSIIIVAKDSWESGVLGIVSARVTEKYCRPSIVFGKSGNVYKGSSRSVGDVNIVKTIEMFKDMITSFGGHSMAAGLSVSPEKFTDFSQKITEYMNANFSSIDLSADKFYDFALTPADVTPEFSREIERLEPFGCENSIPCFSMKVAAMQCSALANYPLHLRILYGGLHFMYFGGADTAELLSSDIEKDIIFEFQKSEEKNDVRELRAVIKGVVPNPTDARGYALTLAGVLRGRFAAPEHDEKFTAILHGLSVEREEFIKYYRAIQKIRAADGIYDCFSKTETEDLDLYQFVFCATVFSELKILEIGNHSVRINYRISSDLFKSTAYNFVREKCLPVQIESKSKPKLKKA